MQLKRMRHDGVQMRKRLGELREQSELWAQRAVASAELDEKRALECIKRKQRCERDLADVEEEERELKQALQIPIERAPVQNLEGT